MRMDSMGDDCSPSFKRAKAGFGGLLGVDHAKSAELTTDLLY